MCKVIALVVALAACGSKDKCEQVTDRLAPLVEAQGKATPRADEVAKCHAALAADPKYECMLDCIISLEGELSGPTLIKCANTDKYCKKYGSAAQ